MRREPAAVPLTANHHEFLGDISAMMRSRWVPASPAPAAGRRAELDVMRALVVVGLVIFHSAVVFASGTSWFVKDPRPSVGFAVFLLWASLWGMPLLFVVSGIGIGHALRSRSAGAFVTERVLRLLVPFLVGLTLLVPPMFYLEYLRQSGFHESYGRFWLRFLNVPAIASGLLPRGSWTSQGTEFDPAHLWFLYCLLTFSLLLLPLLSYLRSARGIRLVERTAAFTTRHRLAVLLAGGIPMALIEATFGPDVNTGGWERLTYVVPLLIGYLIALDPRFDAALRDTRRPALACALLGTVALTVWVGLLGSGDDVTNGNVPGWSALQGLTGWWWIAAIMGFASSLSRRPCQVSCGRPHPDQLHALAQCRGPLREPSGTTLLRSPRADHRRCRLGDHPLAMADPRQVPRAGHRIVRRDTAPLRAPGPTTPPHPAALRHETGDRPPPEQTAQQRRARSMSRPKLPAIPTLAPPQGQQ